MPHTWTDLLLLEGFLLSLEIAILAGWFLVKGSFPKLPFFR